MQTKLVSVRYDTSRGAFEARVDVERDGRTFRYPCRVEAAEDASRDWLEAALTGQALRMSDTRAPQPARQHSLARALSHGIEVLAAAFRPGSQASQGVPVSVRSQPRLH